jgi:hypothetical protein
MQGVERQAPDSRPGEDATACGPRCVAAGLFLCVVAASDAMAATQAVAGATFVDPVRAVDVEFAVTPARPGMRTVVDPATFRPKESSSRPSGVIVNVSALSGRLRAKFFTDTAHVESDAGIEGGEQDLSLDYDLWRTRRSFAGHTFELSTTLSHRLSFDTLHDPARGAGRDDYRARSGVLFVGRIGTLEWGLRQGWSGGYVSGSSGERSAAEFDTTFDASVPVLALARAVGFAGDLEYSPKLLFQSSRHDVSRVAHDRSVSSEGRRRDGVGVSFAGRTWRARYFGSRRMRDVETGWGTRSVLRAIDHDLRLGLTPAESLRIDLGLRWDDIADAGRQRREVARTLDVGWRFADGASLAVGLFARERNARDTGTKERKRGLETRLELPILPSRGRSRFGSLGGRFVVEQHLSVFDRRGAGGAGSNGTSWSVLCSLELSTN